MPDWPPVPLYLFLVVVALTRAGATYALARGARGVADQRSRFGSWRAVSRGEDVVRRYGAPAVTLCFLTVGVQTAVNAAAGTLRMPLRRYLPALFVGAVIWAAIYTVTGLAVLEALWRGGVWRAVVAVLLAVALGFVVARALRPAATWRALKADTDQ